MQSGKVYKLGDQTMVVRRLWWVRCTVFSKPDGGNSGKVMDGGRTWRASGYAETISRVDWHLDKPFLRLDEITPLSLDR